MLFANLGILHPQFKRRGQRVEADKAAYRTHVAAKDPILIEDAQRHGQEDHTQQHPGADVWTGENDRAKDGHRQKAKVLQPDVAQAAWPAPAQAAGSARGAANNASPLQPLTGTGDRANGTPQPAKEGDQNDDEQRPPDNPDINDAEIAATGRCAEKASYDSHHKEKEREQHQTGLQET